MTKQPVCGNAPALPEANQALPKARHGLSRRAFVASLPAVALPAAASAATAPGAVSAAPDPHIEWLRQWREIRAQWHDSISLNKTHEAPECLALWEKMIGIEDLLTATPAATVAGVSAQMRWAVEDSEGGYFSEQHDAMFRLASASLERLTGRTSSPRIPEAAS